MAYIGVNQNKSMEQTLKVVKKYLLQGKNVQIIPRDFGECMETPPYEHTGIEYEVYVDFKEGVEPTATADGRREH